MLHEISPHNFNNEYSPKRPQNGDYLLVFSGENILMKPSSDELTFTSAEEIKELNPNAFKDAVYLFSMDNVSIFCVFDPIKESENFKYVNLMNLRDTLPEWMLFIAATAGHLSKWYDTNRFCGRCSDQMHFSEKERSLCCKKCGLIKYPKITPAVIVAITDKDKILLTRYSDRPYKKLSLVAGFVEIGETLEEALKREVMEEVGLKVKNFRYFKSQPWAFSQSLLMGFFVELEGSPNVTVDESELSEATWFSREEIPPCETTLSLTNEMIEAFRTNKIDSLSSFL